MNINKTKDLAYYEALPYTVIVRKDEDGDFVARINELPGCLAHGSTEASAVENVHSMQRLWIEDALAQGDAIPEPEHESEMPSGKWVQRVPRKLHKDLVVMAERENVSLNQLVTSMLAEALTARTCTHVFKEALEKVSRLYSRPTTDISALWGRPEPDECHAWTLSSGVRYGSLMCDITRVGMIRAKDDDNYFLNGAYVQQDTEKHRHAKQLTGR